MVNRTTPISLLEQVRRNDQNAWRRFVHLYSPLIYHWCRRWQVNRGDIEDVMQEVFRGVAMNIKTYRRESDQGTMPFRYWLAGVTRNKLIDYHRQRGVVMPAVGGSDFLRWLYQDVPQPAIPDDEADISALEAVYLRALDIIRVDFEQRTWQAFWRTAVDGLSAAEAAVELQMNVASVRKAKSRVLHRLREIMDSESTDTSLE